MNGINYILIVYMLLLSVDMLMNRIVVSHKDGLHL